jgi:hypothetical protein
MILYQSHVVISSVVVFLLLVFECIGKKYISKTIVGFFFQRSYILIKLDNRPDYARMACKNVIKRHVACETGLSAIIISFNRSSIINMFQNSENVIFLF